MFQLTGNIEIKRTPNQVYDFLADPANIPKWEGEVLEVMVLTPGPLKVGSEFTEKVKMSMKTVEAKCMVTVMEPGKAIGFSAKSSMLDYNGTYYLEPVNGGTRINVDAQAEFKGMLRLVGGMMKGELQKEVTNKLGKLKEVIEAS